MSYPTIGHFLLPGIAKRSARRAAPPHIGAGLSIEGLIRRLDGARDFDRLDDWLHELRPASAEMAEFAHFGEFKYRRNLICRRDRYEVLMLCWRAGQHSPIHDHSGSMCAIRVLAGKATEVRFEAAGEGRIRACSIQTICAGAVTTSADADMHVVANWASDAADLVTLHVYSPPLQNMRVYGDDMVVPVKMSEIKRLPAIPREA